MIVHIDELIAMQKRRAEINATPIEQIEFWFSGEPYPIDQEIIDDIKFSGLSNISIIDFITIPEIDCAINSTSDGKMKQKEMIKIAKRAIDKGWDIEELRYSDDLYGREDFADDVWDFVIECEEIGSKAFYKKYPD